MTLGWTRPAPAGITQWKYRTGTISGTDTTWAGWQLSGADTNTHLVESLTNGTVYTFQVRAVNPTGDGPPATASAAVIPAGPPDPPALTVQSGYKRVTLRWTPGADNGSAIERHELRSSADGGTTWDPDWTSHATPEQIIRNLLNDTEYTFQMQAKNAVGYSTEAEVKATPRHPIEGPTTISFAENREDRVAAYRFSTPSDLELSESTYRLELSDIEDSALFQLDRQGRLSFLSAPDFEAPADADQNNLYSVWLRAAPSSEGEGAGVRAEGPPTFTKQVEVTVTNEEEPGTVTLSSTQPQVGVPLRADLSDPDGGVTNVRWAWSYSSARGARGVWEEPGGTDRLWSTFTPYSLLVGQQVRARAVYDDGHGADKQAQSALTEPVVGAPDPPGALTAEVGDGQVALTWETPADNGSALTGYEFRHSSDGARTWAPDWGTIRDSDAETTSHRLERLTNGTEYTFEVRAVNGVGAGDSARGGGHAGAGAGPGSAPAARGGGEWAGDAFLGGAVVGWGLGADGV